MSEQQQDLIERQDLQLEIEELEERIAPAASGQLGFEGQPGNQSHGNPGHH
jgi:hypothetical protein